MNNIKETIVAVREYTSKFIFSANRALIFVAPLAITGMVAGVAAAVGVGIGAAVSFLYMFSNYMRSAPEKRSMLKEIGGVLLPAIIGGAIGGTLAGGPVLGLIAAIGAGIGVGVTTAAHFGIAYVNNRFIEPREHHNETPATAVTGKIGTLTAVAAIGLAAFTYSGEAKQLPVIKQMYEQKNSGAAKDFNNRANPEASGNPTLRSVQPSSPKQG